MSTGAALLAPRRFPSLFWSMIWRPHQALAEVHHSRRWVAMALISTVLAVLPVLVAAPIAAREAQEAVRRQLEAQPGGAGRLSPELQQQAVASGSNPLLVTVLPAVAKLASLWVGWLVWAGGLSLLSALAGGKTSFRQLWPLVVWAWLPFALRGLLQSAFILGTGELIANPGLSGLARPVETSGLLAAPPGAGQLALAAFLGYIDLFLVWNLALLATGVRLAARLSTRKAILVTLGLWLVLALIGLLPAVLSGSLLGGF